MKAGYTPKQNDTINAENEERIVARKAARGK